MIIFHYRGLACILFLWLYVTGCRIDPSEPPDAEIVELTDYRTVVGYED